ncbi:MAG: methionyl-tRNA formyltransferase, partial [Candidatus Saccharimonadales bacterium]
MKKTSKKIVFFGNERLATGVTTEVWTLRQLLEEGYVIAAVVVAQKNTGPSRSARPLEIVALAEKHHIPVLSPEKPADIAEKLQAFGADIGVLVAYGKIVPQSVIDIFPAGIVNIHPSLLPKHRGPTPIESAILNGDEETGVSLMKLTAQMDTG